MTLSTSSYFDLNAGIMGVRCMNPLLSLVCLHSVLFSHAGRSSSCPLVLSFVTERLLTSLPVVYESWLTPFFVAGGARVSAMHLFLGPSGTNGKSSFDPSSNKICHGIFSKGDTIETTILQPQVIKRILRGRIGGQPRTWKTPLEESFAYIGVTPNSQASCTAIRLVQPMHTMVT